MKGIQNRQKKIVTPKQTFKKEVNKFQKAKKDIKKKDQLGRS
ncbi:MAG: hypothetical protein ACOY90_17040 [Candidatus Zhuqueibacterota bacterium]